MKFDAHEYFEKKVRDKMKICVEGDYKYSRISSMQHMEEVLDDFRYEKAFFAVDDTEDGFTYSNGGSGYMDRKTITIYILKQYNDRDMKSQDAALAECRTIYNTVLKKLIKDKADLADNMVYVNLDRIRYTEIPGMFANSCTGLFCIIPISLPVDLSFKADEWLM